MLLRRFGPWALCLSQCLVGVRTVAPRLAGASGIGYRRFATASIPAAACWGSSLVLLAYSAGAMYEPLSRWLGIGGMAVLAGVTVVVLVVRRVGSRVPVDA